MMKRLRGYTIVEMLIALTALGLVLGGALVPLQQRLQEAEMEAARAHLQQAQDAIYGYVLANTTASSRVTYFDNIVYDLPAGRPYLPCPDIDRDGLEDRSGLPSIYPVAAANLISHGVCDQHKGMLPWRTLGLPELDQWGNYLTYRVDRKYASQLYGFDETFNADSFNYAGQVTFPSGDPDFPEFTSRDNVGAVVCSDMFDNSGTGGCPNLNLDNIEAGVYTDTAVTLGARRISPYTSVDSAVPAGIVDGPVFVIVSHGRDGAGAIGRNGTCRAPAVLTNNLVEIINAYYRASHPFRNPPFNCTMPTTSLDLYENTFVTTPISDIRSADLDTPDDIVLWGSTKQMYGFLARNDLIPLEKIQYLDY